MKVSLDNGTEGPELRSQYHHDLEWVRVLLTADPGVNMEDVEDQEPPRRKEHHLIPSTIAIEEVKVGLLVLRLYTKFYVNSNLYHRKSKDNTTEAGEHLIKSLHCRCYLFLTSVLLSGTKAGTVNSRERLFSPGPPSVFSSKFLPDSEPHTIVVIGR
ncbi:hypothetical protein IFM89_038331 [Coptis chinensis]|uniref:Uncharacterized protein n=1 Tax=Coptis chinensis TaxID=261450 RepID=A0A835LY96_9MAGN|nr:hypothetical protein IFM89_038331 [Coptis chinensis]